MVIDRAAGGDAYDAAYDGSDDGSLPVARYRSDDSPRGGAAANDGGGAAVVTALIVVVTIAAIAVVADIPAIIAIPNVAPVIAIPIVVPIVRVLMAPRGILHLSTVVNVVSPLRHGRKPGACERCHYRNCCESFKALHNCLRT
jgi:hypothetical protein